MISVILTMIRPDGVLGYLVVYRFWGLTRWLGWRVDSHWRGRGLVWRSDGGRYAGPFIAPLLCYYEWERQRAPRQKRRPKGSKP